MNANEEMYRRIVRAVPEGIWVVNPQGRTNFCNERMAEMLGTDIESLQRLSCFDPVFPADLEEAQRQFGLQMVSGGQPFDFRLRRIDGSELWVSISCRPIYDDGGVCTGLLGLFTDISERRRAESGLRESEERFRAIFFQAAVGIAQNSPEGEWLLLNDRLCEMLGYTQAELRGKTFLDIVHLEDREASLVARRQLLAGEISSWSVEKRYIHKNGATIWARAYLSLVRDEQRLPLYFISVIEDITDRIQAERALRDSEQRLTLAQNAAHLGIFDQDLRTNIITGFGEYASLYGLPPDHRQLTYEEWLRLIHPDDRERVLELIQDSLEGKHVWDVEFQVVWPDGSVHWLLGKGTVFLNDSGQPVRVAGVNLDITEGKLAEAALREKQQRLISIYNTVEDVIFHLAVEPEGQFRFISVNAAFLRVTGLSQEQVVGKTVNEIIPEPSLPIVLGKYRQAIEEKTVVHWEETSDYPTGRLTGEVSVAPVFDNEGTCTHLVGSVHDITQRKRDEAVLRDREERLRASEIQLKEAQRLAKVGSWERYICAGQSYWSDEIHRIFGLPNDAPASLPAFINCVHPKDREKVLEAERNVRLTCGPVETEYRIIRPDGEVRFLRSITEAITSDQGVPVRITGATQDITEQVKAREHLRQSEEHLKNAERLAHVGSWHFDIQANRVSWSDEMFRIFGRPRDYNPSYEGFLETLLPQDRQRLERLSRKAGHSVEYQVVRPNGDLRTVSSIWEVVLDDEGSPVCMFGACQDITNIRRAQEVSFARQKLESVGTLAGGIAHDFNNLLGGILAEAEVIEQDLPAGSPHIKELHRIKEGAIRGSEIVRELMIYSGQDKADPVELIDLSRLVEKMLELLKVSISKHAVLKTDLHQDLPAMLGRAPQIRQIVMNLIINASEVIGEEGGVIEVATSHTILPRDAGPNSPPHLPSGDYLTLEVSDTGGGMTEEVQAKVFDPFFSTKFTGRGLGLAVVQGIVREHGGAINLVSAPGQGSKFEIFLPCVGETAQSSYGAIARSSGKEHRPPSETILVVEDEGMLRLAISKMLRKKGFSVIEASDGTVALDLLRAHKDDIDLLLLDVTLPGAPSREVLEEARHLRPDLPVIITSANSEVMAAASLASRVERFIRKPFALDHLIGLIRESLLS